MHFEIEWLDDALNAAREECATACDLRLWIGGVNATEHVVEGAATAIDHVTIAAYPLAEGLAHDWWAIFGGRDHLYRLTRHRTGYALPDVRMQFDGQRFEITTPQRPYGNPPVRFWSAPVTSVPRDAVEGALSDLIERIVERLASNGIDGTGAQLRWRRVTESRQDAEESAFCESAGALGLDPYTIDDAAADFIEKASGYFVGEALIEFLAGMRTVPAPMRVLDWLSEMAWKSNGAFRFPELTDIANDLARPSHSSTDEPAWSLGYRRARDLRHRLGLGTNDRIGSPTNLAVKLGAVRFPTAGAAPGIRALVKATDDPVEIYVAVTDNTLDSGKLFALGRAAGQYLCFPDRRRSVVNRLAGAYEQAAGRAFAAEFLAPIEEIRSLRADGFDDDEIAAEFGVSDQLIAHQLQNEARIDAACASAA